MIKRWSELKCAATEQENQTLYLQEFEKRARVKRLRFNKEEVLRDILRWQEGRRRPAYRDDLASNILNYPTHKELKQAVAWIRTRKEIEAETARLEQEGRSPEVFSRDGFTLFPVTTGEAFAKASAGTKWCTKDVSTAFDYLKQNGTPYILRKDGESLAVLFPRKNLLYWRDDTELKGPDTGRSPKEFMSPEGLKNYIRRNMDARTVSILQQILSFLGMPQLKNIPEEYLA